MKTIGLIGGMSWESTVAYYRILNETVKARWGGLHSAKILMYSVDFEEIEQLQHQHRWSEAGAILAEIAQRLEAAQADCLVLCTNTMHKVADIIEANLSIPFLHIADATGQAIKARGLQTVGLLGTRFTMEDTFYKDRLIERYGLTVLTPEECDRTLIHTVIYEELCLGILTPSSREQYRHILQKLVDAGAEGIILGCTEIGLLVKPEDSSVPLFDTTEIHAVAAAEWAMAVSDLS
jgi:aspartate racemase